MANITTAVVGIGISVLLGTLASANGAELYAPPAGAPAVASPIYQGCRPGWLCGPERCDHRRACRPTYSEAYVGYPLYGAYGPYGGSLYWGAYTAGGWGFR
jgi:hypothetical protein